MRSKGPLGKLNLVDGGAPVSQAGAKAYKANGGSGVFLVVPPRVSVSSVVVMGRGKVVCWTRLGGQEALAGFVPVITHALATVGLDPNGTGGNARLEAVIHFGGCPVDTIPVGQVDEARLRVYDQGTGED